MVRHVGVDLARQFDKAGWNFVLARLPGQIERINRDTVPTKSRAGVKGHEAERLRFCRFDHLPDIDAHSRVDDLQFVHERDVDGAKYVLGQLYSLRRSRRGHWNRLDYQLVVKRERERERVRAVTPNHLWDRGCAEFGIARIF